nr:AHH domain-containing protein [Acinetobacter lanii]
MPKKQGYQRQHIIPYSLKGHEVFVKSGMNINGSSNLMYMPVCEGIDKNPNLGLHRNWTQEHKIYNNMVKDKLDDIALRSRGQKWDYRKYQKEVLDLQKALRLGTQTGVYTCALPLNRSKKK